MTTLALVWSTKLLSSHGRSGSNIYIKHLHQTSWSQKFFEIFTSKVVIAYSDPNDLSGQPQSVQCASSTVGQLTSFKVFNAEIVVYRS